MGFSGLAFIVLLSCGTAFAGTATLLKWGVQDVEHPEGITLRQESPRAAQSHGFFHRYGRTRFHRGGGLNRGK